MSLRTTCGCGGKARSPGTVSVLFS
jgi:hypothetical protein